MDYCRRFVLKNNNFDHRRSDAACWNLRAYRRASEVPMVRGASVAPMERGASVAPMVRGANVAPIVRGASVAPIVRGASVAPIVRGASAPLVVDICKSRCSRRQLAAVGVDERVYERDRDRSCLFCLRLTVTGAAAAASRLASKPQRSSRKLVDRHVRQPRQHNGGLRI